MLRETAHEMSLIAFEKKQLLQQWKGALIGLARRDEALSAAKNALKEAQTAARSALLIFRLLRKQIAVRKSNSLTCRVRARLTTSSVRNIDVNVTGMFYC